MLLDFGSARQIAPAEAHPLTNLVSPGFAPIEQYSSSPEKQGPWTDIYALGATLYRAVTGAIPAQATARAEAVVHGGSDPHAPASECAAGLYSEGLLNAIDWALQFRSQDRPQSIADWRKAFDTGSEGWRADDPPALVYKPQATNDESPTEPGQPSTAPALRALVSHHKSYVFGRAGEARRPERRTVRRDRRRRAAVGMLRAHWALAAALIGLCIGLAGMLAGPERDPGQPPPKAAATPLPLAETTPLRPPPAGGSDLGWSDTFEVYGLAGRTEPASKPQPEDLPPDPRDTVQGLLQGAREDLGAHRLTIPEGQNAYDKYRQVLALEPGSRAAADGIQSILDRYLALVYQEIRGQRPRERPALAEPCRQHLAGGPSRDLGPPGAVRQTLRGSAPGDHLQRPSPLRCRRLAAPHDLAALRRRAALRHHARGVFRKIVASAADFFPRSQHTLYQGAASTSGLKSTSALGTATFCQIGWRSRVLCRKARHLLGNERTCKPTVGSSAQTLNVPVSRLARLSCEKLKAGRARHDSLNG